MKLMFCTERVSFQFYIQSAIYYLPVNAGIVVNTPEGVLKARAILLMCSADLPARAILMNIKRWNGAYGCLYCESSGSVLPGDHLHRCIIGYCTVTLCTWPSMTLLVKEAIHL